jgi:DNA-binding transcriptional ArsR family regulator
MSALAQEARLTAFRLLVRRGPDGYTPTALAEKLGVPAPTLSFHLKELQRAGLIAVRREGRFLYYSANFPQVDALVGFLTQHCCSLGDSERDPASCQPVARRRRA